MILKTAVMVVVTTVVAASPALAAQYRTGHPAHVRDYGIYNYAPVSPPDANSPALTGGGSIGYNNHLNKNY
jgi:hypothetical protein